MFSGRIGVGGVKQNAPPCLRAEWAVSVVSGFLVSSSRTGVFGVFNLSGLPSSSSIGGIGCFWRFRFLQAEWAAVSSSRVGFGSFKQRGLLYLQANWDDSVSSCRVGFVFLQARWASAPAISVSFMPDLSYSSLPSSKIGFGCS